MAQLEAGISVALGIAEGKVAQVDIRSTRMVQAARMLAGRSPDQVAAILPAIFSLCGTAQALAGCAAMEAALGQVPSPAHRMARHVLLMLETISEHAQGVLRDWPVLLGETPDLSAIKGLRPMLAGVKRALYPGNDWARPGGGVLNIDRSALMEQLKPLPLLITHLFKADPEVWSENTVDFDPWAARGECVAARLLSRLERDGLAGFGRSTPHLMPQGGPHDLDARLSDDQDGLYVAQPDFNGVVFETNALSRHTSAPLIAALTARHGNGAASRLMARMVEIAAALREVADLVQDLCGAPRAAETGRTSGTGLGMVDAARGLLVHRVEIKETMVSRYQILAPTEWNFHPKGPLHAGLMGAEAGDDLEWRARLLVAALDPCVACTVEVRHA
jgi:hypothetical protein